MSYIHKIMGIFRPLTSSAPSSGVAWLPFFVETDTPNLNPPPKLVSQVSSMNTKWILRFIFFALAVTLPRWYYVEHFAVALPFWDQWDSEWTGLIKLWIEGKLQFSNFFINHNEHRILPTRLMTLLTFMVTGSWNNLTEARLNIPLSAATPLLLIWLLYNFGEIRGERWLVVVTIIAGASLPFSWENFLIGFQSQFYFVNFFTITSLALAVYWSDRGWAVALIMVLCVLAILTVASGLLTPLAVAVVYLSNAFINRKMTKGTMFSISILFLMAVVAYLTMPQIAHHKGLHAESVTEFIEMTIRTMGWPLRGSKLLNGLLSLPALIMIPLLLWRRQISKTDLLMIGCFAWTFMQTLALAYGRGHYMLQLSSRYTEVLLLGLAANSWFAVRAAEEFGSKLLIRTGLRLVAGVFFFAVFISYVNRTKKDIKVLRQEHELRMIQTKNVCEYLKTGNPSALVQPIYQIPYPDAKRFQKILDDPNLKSVIPPMDKCW